MFGRKVGDDGMYESTEGDISPADVVALEDKIILATLEVLEDMRLIDSDDKLGLKS